MVLKCRLFLNKKMIALIKKLYYDKRIRFLFVGGLNTLIGYGTFALFIYLGWHRILAQVVSTAIGTVNSYFWNKYFTFRQKKKSFSETVRFVTVYLVVFFINLGLLQLFTEVSGLNDYLAGAICIVITTFLSFFGHNFFSFKQRKKGINMSKIIITGAGGMIGLALIKQLIKGDNSVIAFVRPGSDSLKSIKSDKLTIAECALDNYDNYIPDGKADIFYHLAWDKTSVTGRDDAEIQTKNIQYALSAVNLAKRFGCHTFVGAGSQAEYGITDQKLNQNTPVNPQSCYGIAKYSAGRLTQKLCSQLEIKHCWTRILSVYGEHDGQGSLIMYLVKTLVEGGTPQLTKCQQIWDYMYAGDTAAALEAIGKHGKDGKTYCLGSGRGRPLFEYVNDIKDYINKDAQINLGAKEYYPHQPMYLVADIEDLINDTGFVPETDFTEGIAKTVEWFRGQKG